MPYRAFIIRKEGAALMNVYSNWVLLTLVMAALPSFIRLPWWVAVIALAGAGLHFAGPMRRRWSGRLISILLLGAAIAGIYTGFETWFSGDAVLSFFIVVVFLKWGESISRRDYLLLIFAAVILAALGTLYFENMLNMLHMFLVVYLLVTSLIAIHLDGSKTSLFFLAKKTALIFVLALPLMLLLFFTFPRIPGPLWDVGLAFGLPVKALMDRGSGDFGKVKSLQPGGFRKFEEAEGNVLVAEFAGPPPFKSQLYWRGQVYYEFDGAGWQLPDNWDDRNTLLKGKIRSKEHLDYLMTVQKEPIHYTLRVMPNGGRMLYGLDFPAKPGPESYISEDFQLMSIRRIDDQEPKFETMAYLEYAAGSRLTEEKKNRALAWPEGTNPRLFALGRELSLQYQKGEEIIHQILARLSTGNYTFDSSHILEPGPDVLDRFFFDERRGGAEYLAGSVAMLLRAAGIPSRLVSGFRGGTIIALTNFVIVKQQDAHAWIEVWEKSKGWYRVEPKDIILPPGDKDAAVGKKTETKQEAAIEVAPVKQKELEEKKRPQTMEKRPKQTPQSSSSSWKMPDFFSFLQKMQKWVINYNPDRQIDIMKGVGIKKSSWQDLLVGTAFGMGVILGCYLLGAWFFSREKTDKVKKAWLKFSKRLEKLQLKKGPQECPRSFMYRVIQARPEMATATEDIIGRYIELRYGAGTSPQDEALFIRQVKRFLSMT